MKLTSLGVAPAATSSGSEAPASIGGPGATPADFLAALLAALSGAGPTPGPVTGTPEQIEQGEPIEQGDRTTPGPVADGARPDPGSVEGSAQSDPGSVEDDTPTAAAEPTLPGSRSMSSTPADDPALTALLAQQPTVISADPNEQGRPAARLAAGSAGAAEAAGTAGAAGAAGLTRGAPGSPRTLVESPQPHPRQVPASGPTEVSKPAPPSFEAVAQQHLQTLQPTQLTPQQSGETAAPQQPPLTAGIGPSPVPTIVLPASGTTAPAANTDALDRVAAQVFGEVTGLVSKGNGTHRITMTLNPEQLGEVRVVMTVRNGAVHVQMAAGHETRGALLDGSPELSRLLESAGATDTRIIVRDLPALATTPPSATANSPTLNAGHTSDGSPDQQAGTHADHQAKDGSDHTTSRSARTEGSTSPGHASRSNQPVIAARSAGVDLTM